MPRYIIKLKDEKLGCDWYLEWSTIVDAPITYGMSLQELEQYIQAEYGRQGLSGLAERLERVELRGTSLFGTDLKSALELNRAGKDESHVSLEYILDEYCRKPIPGYDPSYIQTRRVHRHQ